MKDFTNQELCTAGAMVELLELAPPEYHEKIRSLTHEIYLLAREDVQPAKDAAVEANRQALLDRSNVGIVKYGTTLMDNKGDLRYWLNHALEECLDQANYLRRAIMEIDNETK